MIAGGLRKAARVAALIVCALLAVQVIRIGVSGLMLPNNPEGALTVWSGSAAAASQSAENLIKAGKTDEAQALAVRALAISAQESQALHTLAAVGRARGNPDITDTALTIAAHLGWRDVFVQGWVLERAVRQGDMVAISQAGDALLRTGFDPKLPLAAFRALLTTPQGRTALAERMSARPGWARDFLLQFRAGSPQEARDFGALLVELDRLGARPGDHDVQPFFEDIIRRGDFEIAIGIWSRMNSRVTGDPSAGLIDGGFSDLAADSGAWGPFGWRLSGEPNISVATAPRSEFGNDPMLDVSADSAERKAALTQLVALRPGNYELVYDGKLNSGRRTAFQWVIHCTEGYKHWVEAPAIPQAAQGWATYRIAFTVPAEGCRGQMVALYAGPVTQGSASASFDSMQIRPR